MQFNEKITSLESLGSLVKPFQCLLEHSKAIDILTFNSMHTPS